MPDENIVHKTASLLLQINAIRLNVENPFTWSSGWKSPIYCDNRISLSFPEVRNFIKENMASILKDKFPNTEMIAGVATAGIAHAALIADHIGLPMCYVRATPKSHGMENLIEGQVFPGQKIVVVEDLISTGGSSLNAVEALRKAGAEVLGMIAIFTYGFEKAKKNFEAHHCPFITLTNYQALISEALKQNLVSVEEMETLNSWRVDPDHWGKTANA